MEIEKSDDPTLFIMPFGRHKGETLEEIYVDSKGYLEWAIDNMDNPHITNKIEEALTILNRKMRVR